MFFRPLFFDSLVIVVSIHYWSVEMAGIGHRFLFAFAKSPVDPASLVALRCAHRAASVQLSIPDVVFRSQKEKAPLLAQGTFLFDVDRVGILSNRLKTYLKEFWVYYEGSKNLQNMLVNTQY